MQTQVEIWNQQIQISYLTAFDLLGQVTQEYLESLKYIYTFIFMFLSIPKNEAIHDQLTGWQSVCCQSHMLHRDALSPETHWF